MKAHTLQVGDKVVVTGTFYFYSYYDPPSHACHGVKFAVAHHRGEVIEVSDQSKDRVLVEGVAPVGGYAWLWDWWIEPDPDVGVYRCQGCRHEIPAVELDPIYGRSCLSQCPECGQPLFGRIDEE